MSTRKKNNYIDQLEKCVNFVFVYDSFTDTWWEIKGTTIFDILRYKLHCVEERPDILDSTLIK